MVFVERRYIYPIVATGELSKQEVGSNLTLSQREAVLPAADQQIYVKASMIPLNHHRQSITAIAKDIN